MAKQIFPKEIVENTAEVHQFKHTHKSKIIYSFILLGLISAFISLPFIKIGVYNSSQGLIRPSKERSIIQNINSGKVVFHALINNLEVRKGDTLLLINNAVITQKINNSLSQLKETKIFIEDLKDLSTQKKISKKIVSLKYKQEYSYYQQKLSELQTRFQKIKRDYNRNEKLFEKGVIARVALDTNKLEYDLALNAIHQYKKQQHSSWQGQLVKAENQLKQLENNHAQLEESSSLSVIKAPVSGTLLNIKGIEKGSFIQSGFQLAEISPKAALIVECYISPADIGLLTKENQVKFQVTAFNYNQWGLATGKIVEIGNDVQIVNNTPMFRVLCAIDQEFLQLKNGFKGQLKKGMLVNARFELTERSLFDLLYDKTDDWLNPSSQIAEN
jgi:HlyD family secretion protein